jgi:hypothetical protein
MTATTNHITTTAPTTGTADKAIPWAAVLTVVAGGIFLDGAILTGAYRGSSPVSKDALAFPWEGATAVASSLSWGLAQALMVVGLVAFARSDTPSGRLGRAGAWLAVAGGVAYTIAHLVSVAAYDASTDETDAIVAMSLFGVGTVALAIGLLLAGRSSLRGRRTPSWIRWAPLALGLWMVLMIPLQFTSALVIAVGGYAILVVAFGVYLMNDRSAIER